MPTGQPSASTTGNSLILRSARISIASVIASPARTVVGAVTITSLTGRSRAPSLRFSIRRAKSLSVNKPASRPRWSVSMIAPVRRPGFVHDTRISRIVSAARATRQSLSCRMVSSTWLSFSPSAPLG